MPISQLRVSLGIFREGRILIKLALKINKLFLEADEVFSFVRQLPKKTEAFLNREFELECQVNSHKAPVSWYKGEEKIEADGQRFEISKDLTGLCRLIFKGPIKEDNGEYTCKIEKQNVKTTCNLKFKGMCNSFLFLPGFPLPLVCLILNFRVPAQIYKDST